MGSLASLFFYLYLFTYVGHCEKIKFLGEILNFYVKLFTLKLYEYLCIYRQDVHS